MKSNTNNVMQRLRLALAGWTCIGLAMTLSLTGCGGGGGMTTAQTPAALQATTEAGLTAYFRKALAPAGVTGVNGSTVPAIAPIAVVTEATASASTTSVFSGTTLQETGVDEADLIKSDGTQVFSLDQVNATDYARSLLRRQRLNAGVADAALTPVDSLKIPFSGDVRGTGLYLDSERHQLAAVAEGSLYSPYYFSSAWFVPQAWAGTVTEVALIDTSGSAQMSTRRTLRMTARLIGSRRLGATLYLVLRSYPQVPGLDPRWSADKTASNNALIASVQAAQLLPTLSIDGGPAQALVDASSCLTQADNAAKSADIITVVGIDLAADTHKHAAICFTGGTEAFYMSEQSLYLATTRSTYTYSGAFPVYAAQTNTDIHKFALNGLDIAYRGSGSVTGHLGFDQNRKSFRMGEHNGMLRVITQTQTSWGGWFVAVASTATTPSTTAATTPIDSPGRLSILRESAGALAVVGELPNANRPQPLGKPGEQLYASRFLGARGYLVTYRLTDPLYVLDLSNPADPRVAGELQVDGYSDYLFPLTENLLLGVGKDAQSDGTTGDGRFAWYQGVKVSLIDVSDPAHPREAARSIIGRRGTDATVLHDHHGIALQTVGNTVRLALPVSLHDSPPRPSLFFPTATGALNAYFTYTRTELQRFEINLTDLSLSQRPALVSSLPNERYIGSDRSLLWNDQVHYYQDGTWTSSGW